MPKKNTTDARITASVSQGELGSDEGKKANEGKEAWASKSCTQGSFNDDMSPGTPDEYQMAAKLKDADKFTP